MKFVATTSEGKNSRSRRMRVGTRFMSEGGGGNQLDNLAEIYSDLGGLKRVGTHILLSPDIEVVGGISKVQHDRI